MQRDVFQCCEEDRRVFLRDLVELELYDPYVPEIYER